MKADRRGNVWWRHLCLAATLLMAVSASAITEEAAPAVDNPELEAKVMALSHDLRCLVCQNESIAESRAPLALDLRQQVREQFEAGKNEQEVVDFLVSRYGDFVLYRPPFKTVTALLWLGPGLLLIVALGWLMWRLCRRSAEAAPVLSEEEHVRARALLAGEEKRKTDGEPRA